MNVYIWKDESVWDYISETHSWSQGTNKSYYFGTCFTAKYNCRILKVHFYWAMSWTLRIEKWNYAGQWTDAQTYTIDDSNNPNWVYELSTPYQLTAWEKYVVSLLPTRNWYYLASFPYPKDCTCVTYEYWTDSSWTSTVAYIRAVNWLYLS